MSDLPRLTGKESLILDLLINQAGELYGLQMVNNSDGKLKLGTLYTTLNRMEDKGYIQSRKEAPRPGARGLPRRLYEPTGLGQRVHSAWLAANQHWAGAIV